MNFELIEQWLRDMKPKCVEYNVEEFARDTRRNPEAVLSLMFDAYAKNLRGDNEMISACVHQAFLTGLCFSYLYKVDEKRIETLMRVAVKEAKTVRGENVYFFKRKNA